MKGKRQTAMTTKHPTLEETLTQEQTDGSTSRDTLLLLPILLSASGGQPYPFCLHPVHLSGGKLGFCNRKMRERCACCYTPVCRSHFISCWNFLPDEAGLSAETFPLCETCAALPQEARHSIYGIRIMVNQEAGDKQ